MSIAPGCQSSPEVAFDPSSAATDAAPWRRAGALRAARQLRELLAAIPVPHAALAVAVYLVAAVAFRLQAVEHLNSVCACDGGVDATQFVWAFEWWPYALAHGLNPLVTHLIYAPSGTNLAAATSVPGAALAAAPITALAGPVVAYNVLSLLAPVIGAWFAYRLCLYVTRSPVASIIGGYLFGFSSYGLGQLLGHMHTAFAFAAPAAALLTLKRLDGRISARRYSLLLAIVLIAQLLLSSEMELTLTCVGAAALLCGWFLSPAERRRRVAGLLWPILAAYGLTVLVCSPYLYYEIFHGNAYAGGWDATYFADALNFVIPTPITWLGGHAFSSVSYPFSGHDLSEATAYLGPIQVALVGAFIVSRWRTRTAKFVLALLLIVVAWSFGGHLVVGGHQTIALPWSVYDHLPLFDLLLPVRLTVYIALICALAVAAWIAAPARRRAPRAILGIAAAALLLPSAGATYPGTHQRVYTARFSEPAFFTGDLYRRYLHRDETVLPIPFGPAGESLLWQARTGMYFRMASGYFGAPPPEYARQPVIWQLEQTGGSLGNGAAAALRTFAARQRVNAIVLDPHASSLWEPVLARDGLHPVSAGGILLYRIPGTWRPA